MKVNEKDVGVKNKKLRLVVFIIALAVAVGAFTVGISSLSNKEEGWYTIQAYPDDDEVYYSAGITLNYYFDGDSKNVRLSNNEVTALYSQTLARYYKLFDPAATYEGYENIAALNLTPGVWHALSDELFDALKKADALTKKQEGYSVFAGELAEEWNAILGLYEPQEKDPLTDAFERERIEKITEAINTDGALSLEFNEKTREVKLNKSDAYAALEKEYELSGNVVDLGLLKDAFLVEYTAAALSQNGWDHGIFSLDSGILYSMRENETGTYELLGYSDGEVRTEREIELPGGAGVSFRRAFRQTAEELGYYSILSDGKTLLRSPQYSALTGEIPDLLLTAYAVSRDAEKTSVVDLAYESLILFLTGEEREAANMDFYYTLNSSPEEAE